MEPVINPWVIYFANTCNNILSISIIITIVLYFTIIGISVFIIGEDSYVREKLIKTINILIKIFILFVIICMFCPSRETIYQMYILHYITPDNLLLFKNNIKETIDYIADSVNKLK